MTISVMFVIACVIVWEVGLPAFIILLFWQGRSDGHLSLFAFGWLLGSHGDVVRLCTCGLSGDGSGRVGKDVLMRCYLLSLLLA